jgi:hypothetical protein
VHDILVQLIAAALLTVLAAVMHGIGVAGIAHVLGLDRERRKTRRLHPRTVAILSSVALLLFMLHTTEIALFALFYWVVGRAAGSRGVDLPLGFRLCDAGAAGGPLPGRLAAGRRPRRPRRLSPDRLVDRLLRYRHESITSAVNGQHDRRPRGRGR